MNTMHLMGYAVRRLLRHGVILLAVVPLSFILLHVSPGAPPDPVSQQELDPLASGEHRQTSGRLGRDRLLSEQLAG